MSTPTEQEKSVLLDFIRWMKGQTIGGDCDSWTDEERSNIVDAYLYACERGAWPAKECPACACKRDTGENLRFIHTCGGE